MQDGPLEYGMGAGGQRGQAGYADVGGGAGVVRESKKKGKARIGVTPPEVYGSGVERDSNDYDRRREAWA